jgi:chemotaxis protein CheC
MFEKLSFSQQDLLTEVGTIGTGHAATAMADLIGKKITITVPHVELVSFDRVANFVGGPEQILACVYLEVLGDLPGTVLVMFDEKTACRLLSSLISGDPIEFFSLSALQQSALKEIGNILAGSYLSALGDFSNQRMVVSVPNLAVDMADAVLSVPMIKLGSKTDCALLIQAMFFEEQSNSGFIIFIPDPSAARRLLDIFGVVADG